VTFTVEVVLPCELLEAPVVAAQDEEPQLLALECERLQL
jgi:hypothetical protein